MRHSSRLGIKGSNFALSYDLDAIHFHWGLNNYQGSEHRIDGKMYPLEVIILDIYFLS